MKLIVAMDKNRVIGRGNELPFRQREDLKRVKELTTRKTIVMGSKTFESIGKPLPNRTNIVLTREPKESKDVIFNTLEEFVPSSEIFVFGGGYIYKKLLPFVEEIYLTEIFTEIEGDNLVYFPSLEGFKVVEESEVFPSDEYNQFPYQFKRLMRC